MVNILKRIKYILNIWHNIYSKSVESSYCVTKSCETKSLQILLHKLTVIRIYISAIYISHHISYITYHICHIFLDKLNSCLMQTNGFVTTHQNIFQCVLMSLLLCNKKNLVHTNNLLLSTKTFSVH